MDFFGEQRIRTRRSLLLYGLFFLIVLAHIVVALAIMGLLLTIFTGGIYHWVLMLVILFIVGSFVGGSFLEYRRLRAGGRAIAQRVGAVRLFIDNSQEPWEHSHGVAHQYEIKEKVHYRSHHIAVRSERDFPPVYRRYYEIAYQLAIASGLSAPLLYVLPNEQGINGFVAGRHRQDMVLIVTQGALDKLSDEALYGLIGHEYGHILHGDATFNLQLMVVLAGLQILYDWSDPIPNTRYADNHNVSHKLLSQRHVDGRARNTEAQTTHFTTHSEWVAYWQQQSHQHQSRWVQNTPAMPHRAPRSVWTLLLHGLSFSSMASAQLIKHSFNRERELLADATSVQLTRSPAIIETLKAIHQDPIGSRLSGIADVNGLSHFFFASSGADLGDVSWFATHPSLTERMSAINADAYRKFAVQVVKEKRINQQKIKEIYRQRHLGDWGAVIKNSLSKNSQKKSQLPHRSLFDIDAEENHKQNAIFDNTASNSESQTYKGLEFTKEVDTIIDGRLQVEIAPIDTDNLLKPWQAKPDADLPEDILIEASDIQKVSLPQYVLNHIYHPLGAQALIEAVMLCHQHQPLSTNALYGLADIWGEDFSIKSDSTSHKQVLPHRIDAKLLAIVANLDRRLDSALIVFALAQLRRHDLSEIHIKQLKLRSDSEHSHESDQYYKKQAKCRTMLLRYQQGMVELFHQQLTSDLTKSLACDSVDQKISSDRSYSAANSFNHSLAVERQKSSILSLWQALQLQQLLPILSEVLHDTDGQTLSSQTLKTGIEGIRVQLDPSGQVFEALSDAQMSMVVLLAYRLSKDAKGQMISMYERSLLSEGDESVAHYIVDLRRHARLVDIDLTTVSDVNLQWLLLTAQHLNSIQLLAIIAAVPTSTNHSIKRPRNTLDSTNYPERQQDGSQIDYNDDSTVRPAHHEYRQWLSTLHTVMLHDTIISQDEYDCLLAMSERWLGVRQLF
ncbi:M48 family metalloprotease [Psychrobacter sp. UBA2514]|jgi:Zn-dependent protease with chaperone function|uniref:M48 family metalloprotease n=1 Tax=Psychrobacter sp. UBA2514 TaxID=1947346 RepID=UPI002579A122|nr:M48 family metalloprotease [Psychrobacter sp. UBA2514]|tara:strand:- start:180 stop:3050 length:2871 start_codon:yes stop_codon:yes gene_type:complete